MIRSFDQEKNSGDKKANWLISLLVIGCIAAVSLYFYNTLTDVDLSENNCPIKELPRGEYVVLFDKTDSDKDSLLVTIDVEQELSRIKEMIPQYAKLSIYLITDDIVENYKPIQEPICNPGSLEDQNWFKRMGITGTKIDIENEWNEDFANIVDQNFLDLLSSANAEFSPIFEMIQAVNVLNFKNSSDDYENKLFIFSDMLHYMPNKFSLFQNQPNFDLFKKNNSAYYSEIKTNMKTNVTVEINLIPREEKIGFQNKELETFWLTYFDDMNPKAGSPFVNFYYIGK
jgi:hypothetical protein